LCQLPFSFHFVGGCNMGGIKPKPKDYRPVKLPPEVISAIHTLQQWIDGNHFKTRRPSDDGIQIGCLCGGLMDDGSGRFYFSVHLDDQYPYVWDIALTLDEIKRISSGELDEIWLWCCKNKKCGVKTYIPDIPCSYCDYGWSRPFE
jgi:hypothetical protein